MKGLAPETHAHSAWNHEFDQALEELYADADRGDPGHAAFAMEYLLAVGTRS